MPTTLWLQPVVDKNIYQSATTTDIVGGDWHRAQWEKFCTRMREGRSSVIGTNFLAEQVKCFIPPAAGTRVFVWRTSWLWFPTPPARAHAVELRVQYDVTYHSLHPARWGFDSTRIPTAPPNLGYKYCVQPWWRGREKRTFMMGDPTNIRPEQWFYGTGWHFLTAAIGNFQVRYYY